VNTVWMAGGCRPTAVVGKGRSLGIPQRNAGPPGADGPTLEAVPVPVPVATPADRRPPVARTRTGPGPSSTSTVPSRSVRRTMAPVAVSRFMVAGAGWP